MKIGHRRFIGLHLLAELANLLLNCLVRLSGFTEPSLILLMLMLQLLHVHFHSIKTGGGGCLVFVVCSLKGSGQLISELTFQ